MPDGPSPEDSAPDDAAVRALLASLHDPDPVVPPEVAARLDTRLADLSETTAGHPGHPVGTVVSLPARPGSRRTARGVLVAAAVAAVVGLGAVQVLDPLGGGMDSAETAVTADQPPAGDGESGAASGDRATALASEPQELENDDFAAGDPREDAASGSRRLPSLSTRSFALDVAALPARPASARRPPAACTPGGLPAGADVRAVVLDARPGVLTLLPAGTEGAGEDSRVAEAWQCRDLAGPAGTAAPPRVRVIVAAG